MYNVPHPADDGIAQFGVKPPGLTADLSVPCRFKIEDTFGKFVRQRLRTLLLDAMLATLRFFRTASESSHLALFTPILDAMGNGP